MEEEKRVSAGQKQNGAKSDNGNGQQVPSLGTEQKFFLIECIEQRPCLWDQLCEEFRNNTVRHSAFNDVALLMTQKCGEEFTRSQVQEEWGKMRYCFTRIAHKKFLGNDNVEDATTTWPYWTKMQFIFDSVKRHFETITASRNLGFDGPSMVVCEKWPKENAKGRRKMSSSNSSEAAESAHAAAPKRRTRRPKATLNNQHQQQVGFGVGESIGGGDDQQDALQAASTFPNSLSSLSTATDESSNDLLLQNATALLAAAFNNSRLRQQCEGLVGRYLGHNGYQASSNGDIPAELEPLLASSYSSSVEKEQHGEYENSDQFNQLSPSEALAFEVGQNGELSFSNRMQLPSKRQRMSIDDCVRTITEAPHQVKREQSEYNLQGDPGVNVQNDHTMENDDNDSVRTGGAASNDTTNEFFGRYIIQQMRSVSQKNPSLGVLMRKELMEICCKFELQAFESPHVNEQ